MVGKSWNCMVVTLHGSSSKARGESRGVREGRGLAKKVFDHETVPARHTYCMKKYDEQAAGNRSFSAFYNRYAVPRPASQFTTAKA